MKNKTSTIEERFIEYLDNKRTNSFFDIEIYDIFYRLFTMLFMVNQDFLKYSFEEYRNETNKTDGYWFLKFHKQFRQTDPFDYNDSLGIRIDAFVPRITEDEFEERKNLLKQRKEYINNNLKDTPKYKQMERRLRELNTKFRSYVSHEESIVGHLDMLIWNMVHVSDDTLYNTMNDFFRKELRNAEQGIK